MSRVNHVNNLFALQLRSPVLNDVQRQLARVAGRNV